MDKPAGLHQCPEGGGHPVVKIMPEKTMRHLRQRFTRRPRNAGLAALLTGGRE